MRYLFLLAVLLTGCQSMSKSGTVTPDATVSGPYTITLTSTNNGPSESIYTDFTQTGSTFAGSNTTLACESNQVANCVGDDPPALAFTPTGSVTGNNFSMTLVFANNSGALTTTFTGSVNGGRITGNYTDTQGGAGSFVATEQAGTLTGTYSGTLHPDSNPVIAPTITINLTQTNLGLVGTATVTNSTCFSSLNFSSGNVIGGALTLSNSGPNIFILAVPNTSSAFSFTYSVGQDGACGGDTGTGTLTKN